jgi:hypothetical protein
MDCATNDTAVKKCLDDFDTCANAATTCTVGLGTCLVAKLRCFEIAAPTATQCANWVTMFSNEKLYITAGGDYNGSSLELSCRQSVCAYEAAKPNHGCTLDHQKDICKDMLVPSTIPPPGHTVVVFTIAGNKTKFSQWLKTDKQKAFGVLARMLAKILGTAAENIVIIDAKAGSMTIDFYTIDTSLDVATVQSKLETAKANPNAATDYFTELSTESGVDASTITISSFSVVEATPTPVPGSTPTPTDAPVTPVPATPTPGTTDAPSTPAPGDGSTPAPLAPTSASGVATALAVVAVVAAMLF